MSKTSTERRAAPDDCRRQAIRHAAEGGAGQTIDAFFDALRTRGAQAAGAERRRRALRRAQPVASSPRGRASTQDPRYLANVRALARRTTPTRESSAARPSTARSSTTASPWATTTGWGCTGTLIAPNVVLTAGHCEALHTRVFVGNDVDKKGRVFRVRQHVRHPNFDQRVKQRPDDADPREEGHRA